MNFVFYNQLTPIRRVIERHTMIATYFKATHSNGTVHLRATNGTGAYKFAVVGPRVASDASFSSRLDLARRELERRSTPSEVVPAIEIQRAEYNALNNANKVKCAVTYRGKKFTQTRKVGLLPVTHALGYYRAEREVRVELNADMHPSWLERYPEGFYIRKDREEFRVQWFTREDWALKTLKDIAERGYEVELFTL